jgi:hypothetical protein
LNRGPRLLWKMCALLIGLTNSGGSVQSVNRGDSK